MTVKIRFTRFLLLLKDKSFFGIIPPPAKIQAVRNGLKCTDNIPGHFNEAFGINFKSISHRFPAGYSLLGRLGKIHFFL